MFLSKNKFFVLVLLLSVTFYLMSAPTARADGFVDAVTGVFDSVVSFIEDNIMLVVTVAVAAAIIYVAYTNPMLLSYISDAATWSTYDVTIATSIGETEFLGLTSLASLESLAPVGAILNITINTYALTTITYLTVAGAAAIGGVATVVAACVGGNLICNGNEDAILVMPTTEPITQASCATQQFSISPTFYIPSFNQGFVTAPDTYCVASGGYDDNDDPILACNPIPAGSQRYKPNRDDNDYCYEPDPNGQYVMVSGVGCVPVTEGATTPTSIDETQNKIALYRVTAPVSQFVNPTTGETDQMALVKWFTGIAGCRGYNEGSSQHAFGPGLAVSDSDPCYGGGGLALDRPEKNLLAIYPHSKCSGNTCVLPDTYGIPEDSYIFYAAKILGNYTWMVENEELCDDENSCIGGEPSIYYSPAKFLSAKNPPIAGTANLATFPWIYTKAYSMGDVLWGPTQTGGLEACPAASQTPQKTSADLIVSTAGAGSGLITSTVGGVNAGGFNCGISNGISYTTCSNTYNIGASVTLTATPASGSTFTGWSGSGINCSSLNNGDKCAISMNEDKLAIATFASSAKTLTVTKSGAGKGRVEDFYGGILCGGSCLSANNIYNFDVVVPLTATPAEDSAFAGWSGDCSGKGSCKVTMNADKTVNAEFTKSQTPPGPFNWNPSDDGITSTCNQVMLSWTASAGADGYTIKKDGKDYATASGTATSYTDYTVNQHTQYSYKVEAYNNAGKREISTRQETTPYCSPTATLSVTPGFLNKIYQGSKTNLTWSSTYADSCTTSASKPQSDWTGSMAAGGAKDIYPSPPPSITYNLTCSSSLSGLISPNASVTIDIDALGLPGWKEIIPR